MEHAACKCPKYRFTPWSCWLRRSRSSCQAANPHLMLLVCQVKTLCKMIPTAGSGGWAHCGAMCVSLGTSLPCLDTQGSPAWP